MGPANMVTNESNTVISTISSKLLEDAEHFFNENKSLSDELLQSLYSIFGTTFTKAFDLLDNGRFVVYQTEDDSRNIMKIERNKDQNFIFFDINFCHCNTFKTHVLEFQTFLLCEHVLAAKLSRIVKNFKIEQVGKGDLKNLLNEQIFSVIL